MAYGIESFAGILVSGGSITLNCEGAYAIAVLAQTGDFHMSGGSVAATSTTDFNAMGLAAKNITLVSGEGVFSGFGLDNSEGGYIHNASGTISVQGGHFIFKGSTQALRTSADPYAASLNNMTTYVSSSNSGIEKSLWTSAADGALLSTSLQRSPFFVCGVFRIVNVPANRRRTGAAFMDGDRNARIAGRCGDTAYRKKTTGVNGNE